MFESLLYKEGLEETTALFSESYKDLAIEELVEELTEQQEERGFLRETFQKLPKKVETIRYRQEILQDFMENPAFCEEMVEAVDKLKTLQDYHGRPRREDKKASVWELIDQLNELEVYTEVIDRIDVVFKKHPPKSEGLCLFAKRIREITEDGSIEALKNDLKGIRSEVTMTRSLTLGVNLDMNLMPAEVILMELRPTICRHKDNLLAKMSRYINAKNNEASFAYQTAAESSMNPNVVPTYQRSNPMMQVLTREVEHLLSKLVRNMRVTFRKYIDLDGYFVVNLFDELKYYTNLARYGKKLKDQGYHICMPELSEDAEEISVEKLYNLRLANKQETEIIDNDFCFSKEEKIYILTGPNRGGKTVLTQGVGIAAFLAGMGLFVPADSYKGYPVSQIFTQFPADENETISFGRLGEETVRIRSIVEQCDNHSLILLNETYSTTCASDGLYLARDLMKIFKLVSPAVLYNTHIHELARQTEDMDTWEGESRIVSIVMEIVDGKNTFRVRRSQPDGSSYARNIAFKFGATYEQLLELVK